ncbi:MAG: hypothetical protein EOP11_24955 [Proteobacteria bacterium]|nr:MAG: hypothetical protein EOP11_24955 [Pseudomonadota bacterium]
MVLILALLLSHAPIARAAEPLSFCRPAGAVGAKVNDCEENKTFLTQAEECREALAKEVARGSAGLAALIGKGAADSQSANFSSTVKDYGTSAAELSRLIAVAILAAKDLDSYLDWVVLPEEVDNPDIAGPDMQKYADSVACYGENVKGIKNEIAKVVAMQGQLEAARVASGALGAAAGISGTGIRANEAAPAQTPGGKPSAAPTTDFKGDYQPGLSDISGTKKPPQP